MERRRRGQLAAPAPLTTAIASVALLSCAHAPPAKPPPPPGEPPSGVIVRADSVLYRNKPGKPRRMVVRGTFAMLGAKTAKAGGKPPAPVKGYMYFVCVEAGSCQRDWSAIAGATGSGNCVVFGTRDPRATATKSANGSVRPAGVVATKPDTYRPLARPPELVDKQVCSRLGGPDVVALSAPPGSKPLATKKPPVATAGALVAPKGMAKTSPCVTMIRFYNCYLSKLPKGTAAVAIKALRTSMKSWAKMPPKMISRTCKLAMNAFRKAAQASSQMSGWIKSCTP